MLRYVYSVEVDKSALDGTGFRTTLPIRIHQEDDLARAASAQLLKDYSAATEQKSLDLSLRASCPLGHFASLVIPECCPKKLSYAAKMFEYMNFEDDQLDSPKSAAERHNVSEYIANGERSGFGQICGTIWGLRSKYRRLQISLLVEGIWLCGVGILSMVADFKSFCRMNAQEAKATSLDEYLVQRLTGGGFRYLPDFIGHMMGMTLVTSEKVAVHDVIHPLQIAMVLSNDYFSYKKDKLLHERQERQGIVYNAVAIVAEQDSLTEEKALKSIQDKILQAELTHHKELENLKQNGSWSQNMEGYIEAFRLATGGTHLWAATTPRMAVDAHDTR
ncbi:isoprenoid synthase domain-containing protein [Aspergillus pseudotamarii]|uniref:Isoprenoid synthase domain-containing protein n=1 Tax=Aspergillus pseudotamarii TaxID=132259 RepID=A0A5N6SNX8_ASPPS|nr:isoprenoid synthase domain-containing protein [Aspergillus pseudotamarii]KAE8135063.1 isoprenoid synthase domain-containing protein [Aspergillus pseudotamarii]